MNFCLLLWKTGLFWCGVYFKRREFAPSGSNSFLYAFNPIQKAGNTKTDRYAFLKGVLFKIRFNRKLLLCKFMTI